MPQGDGTGPGRGSGRGGGQRRRGGGYVAGPGGKCVCPNCGATVTHQRGRPCWQTKCPQCGTAMRREGQG